MKDILITILYGIVEGITEWLPISSTGHMILLNEWFKLDLSNEVWNIYLVLIQLGAIMAIIASFFKELIPNKYNYKEKINLWKYIIIGCIPASIVGIFLDDILEKYFYNFLAVAIVLILYGIIFIVIENKKNISNKKLNYKISLFIGIFQILSLIPGTSRSGITILSGILLGLDREKSTKFSFYLSIPIMIGASLFSIIKNYNVLLLINKNEILLLLIGMITSFLISLLVVKFLLKYIKTNDFKKFSIYRIILGIILIFYYVIKIC